MVTRVRYEPDEKSGFLIRLVAPIRNISFQNMTVSVGCSSPSRCEAVASGGADGHCAREGCIGHYAGCRRDAPIIHTGAASGAPLFVDGGEAIHKPPLQDDVHGVCLMTAMRGGQRGNGQCASGWISSVGARRCRAPSRNAVGARYYSIRSVVYRDTTAVPLAGMPSAPGWLSIVWELTGFIRRGRDDKIFGQAFTQRNTASLAGGTR